MGISVKYGTFPVLSNADICCHHTNMSALSLNAQYLAYLAKYPLLTKSVTAGTFAGLNELLSSTFTGDFKEALVLGYKVKHVLSPKLIYMILYGSLVSTPISHHMYQAINKIFLGPMSSKKKIMQFLTSLSTVTPLLAALFTSFISIINNYKPAEPFVWKHELSKLAATVKAGLHRGYMPILKSSLVTSAAALVVAQKFIRPELWVVFFNFVFFILGTYQNTKLKKLQKLQKLQKRQDNDDPEEPTGPKGPKEHQS